MKKIFIILFIILFITACQEEDNSNPDLKPDNIAKSFEEVTTEMHEILVNKIIDKIPEFEIPEKNEMNMLINLDLKTNSEDAFQGKIIATGKSDSSDPDNIKQEGEISLSGELKKGDLKNYINLNVKTKILQDKFFIYLQDFNLEPKIEEIEIVYEQIKKLITKKWLGGTIKELSGFLATSQMNLADINEVTQKLEYTKNIQKFFDFKTTVKDNLDNINFFVLQEELVEQEDWYSYKVELDQEKLESNIKAIDNILEHLLILLDESITIKSYILSYDISNIEGILNINKKNLEFFTFQGSIYYEGEKIKLEIQWLENEKTVISYKEGDGEKILNCEFFKDKIDLVFHSEGITANFEKKGNSWTGMISILKEGQQPSLLQLEELTINNNLIKLVFNTKSEQEGELKGNLELSIKELEQLEISEPIDKLSYEEFMEKLQEAIVQELEGSTVE